MSGKLTVAWDTCTSHGALSVGGAGGPIVEEQFAVARGHAGWLLPMIDVAMTRAGAGPGDIRAIAVGTGPGAFTGVKVGVATAKALSLALSVPLAGIPTLLTLAAAAPVADLALALLDARQGLLYGAAYRREEGTLRPAAPMMCLPPTALAEAMLRLPFDTVAMSGFPCPEVAAALQDAGKRVVGYGAEAPSAAVLLGLAVVALRGGSGGDPARVAPVYLRKPV